MSTFGAWDLRREASVRIDFSLCYRVFVMLIDFRAGINQRCGTACVPPGRKVEILLKVCGPG